MTSISIVHLVASIGKGFNPVPCCALEHHRICYLNDGVCLDRVVDPQQRCTASLTEWVGRDGALCMRMAMLMRATVYCQPFLQDNCTCV